MKASGPLKGGGHGAPILPLSAALAHSIVPLNRVHAEHNNGGTADAPWFMVHLVSPGAKSTSRESGGKCGQRLKKTARADSTEADAVAPNGKMH